jgi:hypothetical protein
VVFAAHNLPKGGEDERVELMRGEVMMTPKNKETIDIGLFLGGFAACNQTEGRPHR